MARERSRVRIPLTNVPSSPPAGDPGEAFRRWLRQAHAPAHSRRTAAENAAFFLPHLRRGMSLLDAGCGPGSITVGLGDAVAPGEVVGIDLNPDAIAAARRLATGRGMTSVRFEVADIHAMPFTAGSFDAVFVHAVLQHVPDATRTLRHLRRVLVPGGVIGVADADYDGSIIAPRPPALRKALSLMRKVRRHSGGDLRVGSKLRRSLVEAGFVDVTGSATASCEGTPDATRATGDFWAAYYAAPDFVAHVTAMGWATEAELSEASRAWHDWGRHPGAFWARFWCEAVGSVPPDPC